MPPLSYAPYYPIAVAKNLRFNDANGIPVVEMYPVAVTQALNTPETSYIARTGAAVSDLMDTYVNVVNTLANYNTRITTLEAQVAAIQASGVTFQLYVNGGCLLGNTTVTVPAAVTALMTSECDYISTLGSTTALTNSIAAQCTNLNSLPAFSQSGTMAGLSGWFPTPTTIASSFSNLWKSYCDARTGIETALAAVTPSCAQVIVAYQAISNTPLTFLLYFSGYTFIPSGYTDAGSSVTITDENDNIYTQSFNIVTQSNTAAPLTISTSGSTLSSQSATYQISVHSIVTNTTLGISCDKVTIQTVYNPAIPAVPDSGCCPDIGNYTATVSSGTTAITLISSLSYTPSIGIVVPKNAFTAAQFFVGGLSYYLSYSLGTLVIHFGGATSSTGSMNIDFITYR